MHAPTSTFLHRGRQYVLASSAGNALIGSARGDSVWLFGLEGTLPPVEAGASVSRLAAVPAAAAPAAAGLAVAAPGGESGRRTYEQACVICHGEDGLGGHGGGAALNQVADVSAVVDVVTAGRNAMPSFAEVLSPEQIREVAAYVAEALAVGSEE
jgi:mono/diheme cytochrome c family protein